MFLLDAFNINSDVIVAENGLWNSDSVGSLSNDWGDIGSGTKETGVESSEASSSVVITKSTKSTNVDGTMTMIRFR